MSVGAMIPVEEYLRTTYSPDREYRDGALVERSVGDREHSLLQVALGAYFHNRRRQWKVEAFSELRIRVRQDWYPIPDLCVYQQPAPTERFPSVPPLLWIEILSQDDVMLDVWNRAREVVGFGVPYVWIIDPATLASEVFTSRGGPSEVPDKTLRIPDSSIVVPLADVIEE
jgi:Uma2 family endonuclease